VTLDGPSIQKIVMSTVSSDSMANAQTTMRDRPKRVGQSSTCSSQREPAELTS
jgi:hypothetical protein